MTTATAPALDRFRLCRSWLFVEGASEAAIAEAAACPADLLIHELEDFTPPERRPEARTLAPAAYDRWRAAGKRVAVRVNPIDGDGMADLAAVMRGRPDIVALPKVSGPDDVIRLAEAVAALEAAHGIAPGTTALLPNIESARALRLTFEIATASPRVAGCVLASEDLAADLGAERGPDATELDHARGRFLVDCVAAGVIAVDCPYTWHDPAGAEADTCRARRLGYVAKSLVDPAHAAVINAVLTPSPHEVARAERVVAAFEAARARGEARVMLDGIEVELPRYGNAKRLLARAAALASAGGSGHSPVP